MSDLVSVIIVNWNGRHHLELCMPALVAQTYAPFEVIVVDNGSTDGSIAYVQRHFPQVRVMALPHNVGFARGNNVGIRAATAPFVATLNNDTEPDPNWLAEIMAAVQSPQIGMVASKMLFYDRPHLVNSAGICMDRLGIAWDRQGGALHDANERAPQPVFGPSAGAALYRRTMLDAIGLFDEDYFAYLEDVDLAWRARLAGWECVYVPTAVVYHRHSATAVEGSPFKSKLLGRNKVWTLIKNYPWPLLLRMLPLILLYDAGSVAVALLTRRDPYPLLGRLLALPRLPTMLRRRRAIQRARVTDAVAWMQPITSPRTVRQRYAHL